MRRALLVVTLGSVLLTATACDSDAENTATAATPPAATATLPSVTPTTPPPDYTADTRAVCGRLQKAIDVGLKGFGTEVGRMIAYKEAKVADEATKSRKAAGAQLTTVATKLRKESSAAKDPALRTAATTSAAKLSRSASDTTFFDRIRTTKDLDRIIEGQMNEWLTPVAGYCA